MDGLLYFYKIKIRLNKSINWEKQLVIHSFLTKMHGLQIV